MWSIYFTRGISESDRLSLTSSLNRMNARENPNDLAHGVPDRNLNGQTVPMGVRLAGVMHGAILARDLSDWIRDTLCGP
jgi:hypothetical protein